MKEQLQSSTSDKQNWKQYAFMSVEQRKKLIEDKLNRAIKIVEKKSTKK